MSGLSGAHIAVIGLGASGVAAARLALDKGGDVYVSDLCIEPKAAARRTDLRARGARVELGGHDIERLARSDMVVVSPGIPPHAPVLRALQDCGVGWISEPEFAFRFFSGPLVAVTGTNGKTTTTLLLGHLLEQAGLRVAVGGNVGGGLAPPASELALLQHPPDWYVLEISSFQLSGIETFSPQVGVLTNLSPDHLDWYPCLEAYYADKAKIFDNADDQSIWVLPAGDDSVGSLIGDAPGNRFYFGEFEESGSHAFLTDGILTLRAEDHLKPLLEAEELSLLGRHNIRNALAASLAAHLVGVQDESIMTGLRTATPLPHRLELVADRNGVIWVNDSKATNVAATRSALESLLLPTVLLLGGVDKGEDFRALVPPGANIRAILAYGAAGPRIVREVGKAVLVEGDLESVIQRAATLAEPGDLILLSPACSSFDMFDNYEERGRLFTALACGSV
ncbi:MAG: UDP-N-acetylmuramoyl-L-alanine--D-glutamate ligase [Gemmatimonadetes bacterium]|nr:UDP-N-acetylmuramoyl-L-alanine--D-glutamate ligase [Gemmatimonadota bacterium]